MDSREDFQGSENTLCDTTMADICHYTFVKPTECVTQKMHPNVNNELWVLMDQELVMLIQVHQL